MIFTLTRTEFLDSGIFGILKDETKTAIAVTLEHSFDGKPKVPSGSYFCTLYDSPKHGYKVFMLNDVPGATFIEIHIGNYNTDSDGCILLGERRSGDMIINSQLTFNKFMDRMKGTDSFTLEVN